MNDDDQDQKWEDIEREEQQDRLEQHEIDIQDQHWEN